MRYLINAQGELVGQIDYEVDPEVLTAKGLVALESSLDLPLDEVVVDGFPERPILVARPRPEEPPPVARSLGLEIAAEDTDGDGVPEIPADGKSAVEITVTLRDAAGQALADGTEDGVAVELRTNHGILASRRATTKQGAARFRLKSTLETVFVRLEARATGFRSTVAELEFQPPVDRKSVAG